MTITETLDDFLIDAEIMVERSGYARFTKLDLAEFLGVHRQSISQLVARGTLDPPAYSEELPGMGRERSIWTCSQVAEALARQARKANPPCGTEPGYRRHRRLNEPVDEACRIAHNAHQRVTRAARKADHERVSA